MPAAFLQLVDEPHLRAFFIELAHVILNRFHRQAKCCIRVDHDVDAQSSQLIGSEQLGLPKRSHIDQNRYRDTSAKCFNFMFVMHALGEDRFVTRAITVADGTS